MRYRDVSAFRRYRRVFSILFVFFNDTATTEIYTLSLHDALPIWTVMVSGAGRQGSVRCSVVACVMLSSWFALLRCIDVVGDRKSTRLNSSHANISYAVFCLKKKNNKTIY